MAVGVVVFGVEVVAVVVVSPASWIVGAVAA